MTDALAAEVARLNNIEQVQTRLGVGRSTVFELIKSKKLRSVLVGRRRLVTEQSLRDFIAQLDQQGGAA
jgi:excisionase family DNA binding protein